MRKTTLFSMLFIGVLVGMLVIPKGANAIEFTIFQADLLNLAELDDLQGDASFVGPVVDGIGVAITQTFKTLTGELMLGLIGGNLPTTTDLTAFSTFELIIENNDDDGWEYRIWASSGTDCVTGATFTLGCGVETAYTAITPLGGIQLLSLAVASLTDKTNVTGYGVDIRLTAANCDDALCAGETSIFPTPEPATVLLLGSGFLGLLGVGRMRRRRLA